MKPKEWLKANGHITEIGRGRMSREHIALVEAAVASGVAIEGYAVSSKPANADKPVERVAVDSKTIADIGEPTRDERSLMAYRVEEGKNVEIGMRTVCNACGSSLTYCGDASPRVWIDHERQAVVNFKPRPEKR